MRRKPSTTIETENIEPVAHTHRTDEKVSGKERERGLVCVCVCVRERERER